MANIQDHAMAFGHCLLQQRPFDALDALILTQLVYMPMEGRLDRGESCTVREGWAFLKTDVELERLDQFQQKRYRLFEVCASLPRYRDWQMTDYVNRIDDEKQMQFCACTWHMEDGQRCVAYRGTDLTLAGWKEDLNMSFMTVPSQVLAAAYAERVAMESEKTLFLCGHSKGGNLAVYAGACAAQEVQERIRRVYSFDGPGMDEDTLHRPEYQRISARIESYIPQSSVVGMLLAYHPVYTVVRSTSIGILQHDAMTWQVENGAFVCMDDLDMSGKITDETLHAWLATMDNEDRRLLVDTLYQVVDAAQADLITDLTSEWHKSALCMLEAIRDLKPGVKRDVRRMIHSLFSSGASEVVRAVLPGLAKLGDTIEELREDSRR